MKMQLKNGLLKGIDKFHRELNQGFKDSFIYYSETMGIRANIVSEWEKFFEKFDLLVCPMSFGPAFKRCKIGTPINYDDRKLIYINYAWPYLACFNASGLPPNHNNTCTGRKMIAFSRCFYYYPGGYTGTK